MLLLRAQHLNTYSKEVKGKKQLENTGNESTDTSEYDMGLDATIANIYAKLNQD